MKSWNPLSPSPTATLIKHQTYYKTVKFMKKRLEEIEERLNEIKKLAEPLWDERFDLEQEREEIYNLFAREIAIGLSWELKYEVEQFRNKVSLRCEDYEERKEANRKLRKVGGDYHHNFYLDRTEDHEVQLIMSDGSLYLTFNTVEDYKKYLKEWGLKVDSSHFREKLCSFKKDIKTLENII